MRKKKELLTLLRDNVETLIDGQGLCSVVRILYHRDIITFKERTYLYKYIQRHRPMFFSKHYAGNKQLRSPYYWKMGEIQPRIDWLNSKINSIF